MWPRVVEVMLACWLAISPFIFDYAGQFPLYVVNDLACAALIATFALLSLVRRLDKLHLVTLLVVAWLIALALLAESSPPPPRLQNYAVLAVLLLMISILPTRSATPPQGWLDFYAHRQSREHED